MLACYIWFYFDIIGSGLVHIVIFFSHSCIMYILEGKLSEALTYIDDPGSCTVGTQHWIDVDATLNCLIWHWTNIISSFPTGKFTVASRELTAHYLVHQSTHKAHSPIKAATLRTIDRHAPVNCTYSYNRLLWVEKTYV